MTIEYREASEADLPAICALGEEVNALHHKAWPHVFAGPGTAERDRDLWAQSIGKKMATTFIAESEHRIIAFTTIAVHDETSSILQPARYARVGSVSVTKRERGKGIGPRLMALAEEWAIARGARDLRLNVCLFNEHALHVYKELGFTQRSVNLGKQLENPDA